MKKDAASLVQALLHSVGCVKDVADDTEPIGLPDQGVVAFHILSFLKSTLLSVMAVMATKASRTP